jgi:putative flippase GtrA
MAGQRYLTGSLPYRRRADLSKRIMRFDLTGGCNTMVQWLAVILRQDLGNAYDI